MAPLKHQAEGSEGAEESGGSAGSGPSWALYWVIHSLRFRQWYRGSIPASPDENGRQALFSATLSASAALSVVRYPLNFVENLFF